MRTTLNIDDDVYETVCQLARSRKRSVGQVISESLRSSLSRKVELAIDKDGWPIFVLPPDAPTLSSEKIQHAIEAMDDEDALRAKG